MPNLEAAGIKTMYELMGKGAVVMIGDISLEHQTPVAIVKERDCS